MDDMVVRRPQNNSFLSPGPLETHIFKARVAHLQRSQWWSRERIEQDQLRRLRRLLGYVSKHVPYYVRLFKSQELTMRDFQSTSDVAKLPLLTKQDVQHNYDDFIPYGVAKENLVHRSTGGSTGMPLTVYMNLPHMSRDKANTEYYMSVAGLSIFGHKSVRIYGDQIPSERLAKGHYWYVADKRKLVMSCYHIARDTAPLYLKAIQDFGPEYIHSRPSALFPLAKELHDLVLSVDLGLRGIFLDGEVLPPGQRDLMESVFGCRVFHVYGHTEGCCVCFSCRHSRYLHVLPHVGVLELLNDSGKPVNQDGKKGEIVVTGLNNYVFPLIRYRTMDIGVYAGGMCSCGRPFRLLSSIEGRVQDYAVDSYGNMIPIAPAVFNYNDMDWKGIRQFQVRQEKPGALIFKVVREPDVQETETAMAERLNNAFSSILAGRFRVEISFVEKLARSRIGKFRYMDQALDTSKYGKT